MSRKVWGVIGDAIGLASKAMDDERAKREANAEQLRREGVAKENQLGEFKFRSEQTDKQIAHDEKMQKEKIASDEDLQGRVLGAQLALQNLKGSQDYIQEQDRIKAQSAAEERVTRIRGELESGTGPYAGMMYWLKKQPQEKQDEFWKTFTDRLLNGDNPISGSGSGKSTITPAEQRARGEDIAKAGTKRVLGRATGIALQHDPEAFASADMGQSNDPYSLGTHLKITNSDILNDPGYKLNRDSANYFMGADPIELYRQQAIEEEIARRGLGDTAKVH